VKVDAVRTQQVGGKEKRVGRFTGRRPDWKKAYVKLAPGQKTIEYFEVV
jgi:large subunit ribosomal protein L23